MKRRMKMSVLPGTAPSGAPKVVRPNDRSRLMTQQDDAAPGRRRQLRHAG